MALPTNASQQQPLTTKVDFTQKLPPELLSSIAEALVRHRSITEAERKDLGQIRYTCKKLRDAVSPILFRELTLKLALDDVFLPRRVGPWEPLRWETPRGLNILQESSELRPLVRRLSIMTSLYPVKDGDDASFADLKQRLHEHRGDISNDRDKIRSWDVDFGNFDASPTKQAERQKSVIGLYLFMCFCFCSTPSFVEDPGPMLQSLFTHLPRLEYVETAATEEKTHALWMATLAYTDRLILRTAPRHIASIGLRCWPHTAAEVDGLRLAKPEQTDTNITLTDARLATFISRGAYLTSLTIGCFDTWFRPEEYGMSMKLWQNGLRCLPSLATLTLSRDENAVAQDESYLSRIGQGQKLEFLLGDLVLPTVTKLTLTRWWLSCAFFKKGSVTWSPGLRQMFPGLESLSLQHVAVMVQMDLDEQRIWTQALSQVLDGTSIKVELMEPKVFFTMVGEFTVHEDVNAELQRLVRRE